VRCGSWPSAVHGSVTYSGAVADRNELAPVAVTAVRPKSKTDGTRTAALANEPLAPAVTVPSTAPGRDRLTCSPAAKPAPDTLSPDAGLARKADSVMCGPVVTGRTVTVASIRWPSARPSLPTALAVNVSTPPCAGTCTPYDQLAGGPDAPMAAGL
jgi:hypothetical protein